MLYSAHAGILDFLISPGMPLCILLKDLYADSRSKHRVVFLPVAGQFRLRATALALHTDKPTYQLQSCHDSARIVRTEDKGDSDHLILGLPPTNRCVIERYLAMRASWAFMSTS